MAKELPALYGNFVGLDTLIDQFFITIKIVIDELIKKSLHTVPCSVIYFSYLEISRAPRAKEVWADLVRKP